MCMSLCNQTANPWQEVQEERRSGPLFWNDSVKQYSAKPERGSEKGWVGGLGERGSLTELSGSGGLEKGGSFEM